jgi:uncharacterized protein (TIGR03437 family)
MTRFTRSHHPAPSLKVLFGLLLFAFASSAQSPVCFLNAGNTSLRSEGLTESAAALTLSCTGAKPGVLSTGSLSITTSVNITNHLSTGNVPDVIVNVTAGGFQQPAPTGILLAGNNTLNISGIQYTAGTDGTVTVAIGNLRLNVNSAAANKSSLITATVISPNGFVLPSPSVPLGNYTSGLLASDTSAGIYSTGSPLPSTITMQNLFAAGTAFDTTRVTEGFSNAFIVKDQNSATGTRIMISYSNLPATTELFVPDVVAGSSALQPTAGGNLGTPQSPGMYASSPTGSLLLSRVLNPNPDGSGGGLAYQIPTGGTNGPITLNSANPVTIANGSAMVVYEVIDANPAIQESAQIPTFVTLTSATAAGSYGQESLSFAPVSTVGIATLTDPVPRFVAVAPPNDCTAIGDCSASYFPHLKMNTTAVTLTAQAYGTPVVGFVPFQNSGSGAMSWNATVTYQTGSGWITLSPTSGLNSATVNVHADPSKLAPGVYNATVTIDAGPQAGSQSVPVTLTVGKAMPLISAVVNAANGTITTLVPGSFASIYGTSLSGNSVVVTFDGVAATTVYTGANQINLLVPSALSGKTSATMLVSADGSNSTPVNVTLATAAPAIFTNGILNQDNSVNGAAKPAARGSILQIFLTGLPPVSGATVNIGAQSNLSALYSGAAPGVPGLQQVNFALPAGMTGTAQLTVCTPGSICTPAYPVSIQ